MMPRNLLIALLNAILALPGTAFAQKTAVPNQQDKAAVESANVKELLLLMDTDKSGKISIQEWMKFMEAEFDRHDHDKTGGTRSERALAIEGVGQACSL